MICLCINIDTDTESWRIAKAGFDRMGLDVQRFSATVGDNRPLAFNQSVLRAMTAAKGDNLLLLEDDATFDAPMPYHEYPENWLSIHYGCNIIGTDTITWQMPTYHSEHLAKLHNCFQSHATLYSAECVDMVLDGLRPDVLDAENNIFDDWFRRNILSMGRSYVTRPMVCYQRPRVSAIWGVQTDYTGAHKQGNKYLSNL